jgi:signal transduction histidine kinase
MSPGRERQRDGLIAAGFALATVIEVVTRGTPRAAILLPVGLVAAIALLWRVQRPLPVLAANLVASIVIELASGPDDYPVALGLALLVAIYSAAAHTSDRDETAAGALLVVSLPALIAAHALDYDLHDPSGRTNTLVGAVFLIVAFRAAWLAGKWVQERRRKRDRLLDEALQAERLRIARELHDVLAHTIGVIVLQARGARHALDDRPEDARAAIDAIERVGADSLAEMRRLLDVLRTADGGADFAPQPSLADLDALVTEVRAAGLPVEVRFLGVRRALPAGVDLCVYRVVQEALTNSLKHAGNATAEVVLHYGDDELDVLVTDTGPGTVDGSVTGHGLAGMRERISLFGGTLESGPRTEGGYHVHAHLPF